MEKEAIEKWIEEYIENTIHITVDKKISLLDPRNVIDERFDYLCNMVDAIQEKLKKIRTEINTYE